MSKQLKSIECRCDAPPYSVVRASRVIGIRKPEDVRWLRAGRDRKLPIEGGKVTAFFRWLFLGTEHTENGACSCGHRLPSLKPLTVPRPLVDDGEGPGYRIGQCTLCHTVYWDVLVATHQ